MKENVKKYLELFRVSLDRQPKVIEQVKIEAKGDLDFFTLSFFAAVIITLGLILNNVAVIIGGMLIAPLVWPMIALALGMVRGGMRLFEQALLNILKVCLLTLLISFLIGLLSPFKEFGSEVLSRTQPTILELVVALAAGFVAAFVVSYPKLGNFIAGVVIAAAIVPPLCVVGLSFASSSLAQAGGAFLLFIANLIAVVLSASLFFYLANFQPLKSEASYERRKGQLFWSMLFLVIILIPLVIITRNIIVKNRQYKVVQEVLVTSLEEGKLVELDIINKEESLFVSATLRAQSNITSRQMDRLINLLAEKLNKSVNLQITVIPTLQGGKIIQPAVQNSVNINSSTSLEDINSVRDEVFPSVDLK